ncbi:MAG TPA: PilW family protein [Methylotenera sp.]|nr:PilW family protein [Methylotenera sp.]
MLIITHHHSSSKISNQQGFSLVELMISIAIGLLLLAALSTLFVNQSRTRAELDKENRMIDNGRYSLDILSENLRLAGFYGEYDLSSSSLPATWPNNPCSTTASAIGDSLLLHVQGYNAASATSAVASPPTCVPSTIKNGSDILVMRRAQTTAIAAAAAVANTTYLQVSLCTPTTGSESPFILATAPATYNLSKKTCTAVNSGPSADLRRFLVQIYYVDSNNVAGDGVPTLKMAELGPANTFTSTPLVEGIEYMQIDYGIDGVDTNADGILDANIDGVADGVYVSCSACTADQWSHVVSVKINILARNLETSTGYTDPSTYTLGTVPSITPNDAYRRHAYTQVVRLTNPAGRRE